MIMGFFNFVKSLFKKSKNIDVKILPSKGLFYKDDFKITIHKVSKEDIIEYNNNCNSDDIMIIVNNVKNIIEKNTKFSNGYTFYDLKGVDTIFLFLEIVKYTINKKLFIKFNNTNIEFNEKNFNYYTNDMIVKNYSKEDLGILVDDYKASLPSIGVEKCLNNYIYDNYKEGDGDKWEKYSYDFIYFLSDKNFLSDSEISNLIEIFNNEMCLEEKRKVKKIINNLIPFTTYSLLDNDGNIMDLKSKINLNNIWKI